MNSLKSILLRYRISIFTFLIMSSLSLIIIIFFYPKNEKNRPISKDGFFFDTAVTITIYDTDENYGEYVSSVDDINKLLDECINKCEKYEYIFSRTNEKSELYKLNNSKDFLSGTTVSVSEELNDLIRKTLELSGVFDKRFSILSGNLCDLWDYNNKIIPSNNMIEHALNSINSYNLTSDDNNIKLTNNNTSSNIPPTINLSACAKGYIADKLADFLKSKGIHEAIINLGGNVLVIGNKYDDSLYSIGIRKPFSDENIVITKCKVGDKSVVTSGIYERYFEKDDKLYHHIIDCRNGYPAETGILSITVICDSSLTADCYATGLLLYSVDEIENIMKDSNNIEYIIVDKDYNVIISEGLTYENDFIILKK